MRRKILKQIKEEPSKRKKFQKRKQSKPKVILLDGLYLANRIKYSATYGLSHEGNRTGLYYGFFNSIKSLINKFGPSEFVLFWDSSHSIRKKDYMSYKNRNVNKTKAEIKEKAEFKKEAHKVFETLGSLGVATHVLTEYEADDIIALYCLQNPDVEKIIVTRDEDFYQLISDNVLIYDLDNKIKKNEKWFRKTYNNISPKDWMMVKAIGGCKSDTVGGVPRVGEITAIKYITNELNEGMIKNITDNWHIVERNIGLVTLPHPSLIEKNYQLPKKETNVDMDELFEFFQEMGFKSLMDNFNLFDCLSGE